MDMQYRIFCEDGKQDGTHFYHIGDGLYYHFHNDSPTTIYFRCTKSNCRGRALLRYDGQFTHTQQHNHPADVLYIDVLGHRRAIVNEARSRTYVSFSEIIRSEKRQIENPDVRSQLTLRSLRPAMQRARSDEFPDLPQHLAVLSDILEDPEWQSITMSHDRQDNIYLGTSVGIDGSHNIVFLSSRCLDFMRTVNIIFADGTFYITPSIEGCYQVFTLVTIHDHTVLPLCWCLMERKSQDAYESILLLLRAHLGHWRFTRVVCDFEDAIINAFTNVFGVEVQGCLFHSADAMARHGKVTIGLWIIQCYVEVQVVIRLTCAIPLLPQNLLQRGLNVIGTMALCMGPLLYDILRPFLLYVQHEWLDHANRGATLSVCGSDHRTNNASETNNRRMKRKIGVHHPNIFQCLGHFSNFEQETFDDIGSLARGRIPTRHRAVSAISNDEFVSRITHELLANPDPSDEHLLTFLCGASLSLKGIVDDHFN